MGRRSAVGVLNGNFRGGMYYEYRKQVEADALKVVTEKKAVVCKVCGGDVEAVPMYPELCYSCYLESVTATAPHPVNEAQEIEREIDEAIRNSAELRWGNVVFDLDAMGENARQRSTELKKRIDQRRADAQARRKADEIRALGGEA